MRHSVLSCVFGLSIAACTASGSDTSQHGQVFDDDGGIRGDGSAPHDSGSFDAGRDASASDARLEASVDDGASANDASSDSPVDAPVIDASDGGVTCTSTMALLAGGATSLAGASFTSGQWSTATSLVGTAAAPIALAPFGAGYVGVSVASDRSIHSTTFASSWSALTTIGTLGSRDAPALAAVGTSLHLAYQAQSADAAKDYKYFHGTLSGAAWDTALDPVGTPQSFGARGPAAAGAANKLVLAQAGSDGFLYDQTWDGAWQAAHQQATTSVENVISPTLVSLRGGASDLLVVYARKTDRHFMYATRTAGAWSAPVEVYNQGGNVAFANDPVTLAALPSGGAVLAYLGGNGKPYFSLFASGTWSAPATIASGTVLSVPSIATGVCGDDAVVAYVGSAGDVNVTRLTGTTWSAPTAIAGAAGMTYAAMATLP